MTEPYPEPYDPEFDQAPRDPEREQGRATNLLGLALFGAVLVVFAGTFLVGLAYLALD